ncbi:MAG: peptidase S41, partial [Deltaproteobacteria bacterium]|nr:peptidase S41 [Deltaproteobacteria bacterium]
IQATGIVPDIVLENVPSLQAKAETRRPVLREENLPGHLSNRPDGEEGKEEDKEESEKKKKEDDLKNDTQLKRALELLKGWEVFKQLVQKKAA